MLIMIERFIDSPAKYKIARFMAENQGRAFTVSEIARRSGVSKAQASRVLRELHPDFLSSKKFGRSVVYLLNTDTEVKKKVVGLLRSEKDLLLGTLEKFSRKMEKENIMSVCLFGSALRYGIGKDSDIDILVVHRGNVHKDAFYSLAASLTEKSGLRLSLTFMEMEELRKKNRAGEESVINTIADSRPIYGAKLEDLLW